MQVGWYAPLSLKLDEIYSSIKASHYSDLLQFLSVWQHLQSPLFFWRGVSENLNESIFKTD